MKKKNRRMTNCQIAFTIRHKCMKRTRERDDAQSKQTNNVVAKIIYSCYTFGSGTVII